MNERLNDSNIGRLLILIFATSILITIYILATQQLNKVKENTERFTEQVEFVDSYIGDGFLGLTKKYITVVKYKGDYYELYDKDTYYKVKDNSISKEDIIYAEFIHCKSPLIERVYLSQLKFE